MKPIETARDALIVIERIASGSTTTNSLPNLARIAREALAAIENNAEPHAVKPWYERCNWHGTEPAVLLMNQAMKAEIAELRSVLASRFRDTGIVMR